MSALVVVMLVAVFLTIVFAGLAVWWAARLLGRLRRSTRRLVDCGALSARAHLLPGTGRRVAATRLQLRTGLDQTRRMLEDASRRSFPLGDLPGLFRRIEHVAVSVDAELRLLDRDKDAAQRVRLAAVLRRSDELTAMAAAIRRTVSGLHEELQLDGFGPLQRDLDLELSALRAGAAAVRQPGIVLPPS